MDAGAPREEMRSMAPNPETFRLRLWVQLVEQRSSRPRAPDTGRV